MEILPLVFSIAEAGRRIFREKEPLQLLPLLHFFQPLLGLLLISKLLLLARRLTMLF